MSQSQQQQQQQQQSSASSSSTAKGAAAPAASSSLDPLIRDLEGGIIVPGAPRPAGPLLKASSQPPSQPASTVTIHLPPSSSSAAIASPNTASNSTTSAKPTIGLAAAAATARARQQQQQRIPADNTGSTSAGPARRPFIPEAIPPAIRRLSTGAGSNSGSSSRSGSALSNTSVQPSSGSAAASRFKGTPPRTTRYSLPVRAEKPVRSSKTTGKHIVLPSESQLAPLPLEEDDDEEESEEDSEEDDDDDDDDDEDEEDESAEEGTVRAETSPDEKKVDDLVPPLPSAAGKQDAAVSEAAGVEVETQVPLSATPADPQRSRAAAALRVSQRRTGPTPAPRITPERSTTLPTLGHTRPLIKQPPSDLPPSALKRPTSAATAPSPLGPTSGAGPKGAVSATSPTTAYPNRIQQARFPPAHARAPPRYPKSSGPAYHTFERLLPAARVPTPLPRVTSFAIGTALHLPTLIGFLRREHGVKPRLYDECVYVVYVKPLLPGFGRANVRSAPEPKTGSP
ncbi:Sad1-interacting factor 3, partial [Tilletia horrida]